jgi:hypothetical protein
MFDDDGEVYHVVCVGNDPSAGKFIGHIAGHGVRSGLPQQAFLWDKKLAMLEMGTFMPISNTSPTYNETQNCDIGYTGVKVYYNNQWSNIASSEMIANEFDDGLVYSILDNGSNHKGASCVLESIDDKACVKVLTQMVMEFQAASPPVSLPFNITATCS